jgi:hypothetical protein
MTSDGYGHEARLCLRLRSRRPYLWWVTSFGNGHEARLFVRLRQTVAVTMPVLLFGYLSR